MTSSGSRRSAKIMVASMPRISAAVIVTSAASAGLLQISSSECRLRTARYSGIYRPAWRMNQTGVRSTGWDLQARTKLEFGADMNLECSIFGRGAPCGQIKSLRSRLKIKNLTTEGRERTEENLSL